MQEFSVFATIFLILALSGGFGETPERPSDAPVRENLATILSGL